MFVCPVPKISQVKKKRRRRASHLGRDTLWHHGRWVTTQLGRFTLCGTTAAELLHHSVDLLCGTTAAQVLHTYTLNSVRFWFVWQNDRAATQLGRFTLWHNGRRAKQPGFVDACTRSRTHFPKTVTNHAENIKAYSKVKFYSGCKLSAHFWKMNALEDSFWNTGR